MDAERVVETAVNIVQVQTKRLRRFLRHNRNRVVYRIQGKDGFFRNVYSLRQAVQLAKKHKGKMFRGEQNARWITIGHLDGIRWYTKSHWEA